MAAAKASFNRWQMTVDAEDITIRAEPAVVQASVGIPTVWQTYSWARAWFEDTLKEASVPADSEQKRHARRREILFAVCFAESYLFEWVRDEVLKRDFSRLSAYFPQGRKRGVFEKWKDIPEQLRDEGLIPKVPQRGDVHSGDWRKLIDYRDGLVHARASRPETKSQSSEERPAPTVAELDDTPPGWAVGVVREQVRRLHEAAGTSPPEWLFGA
jgi:hypothetical protein